MKHFPIIILLTASLASCSEDKSIDVATFKKEIPTWVNGEPDLFYKLAQQKVKQLKIDTLQSGYDSLQIRIWYDYSLMKLPNMDDIPGLEDSWSDGISYHVEVATKKQYRFYGYHLPDKFQNKYWQAKNMVDILTLVGTDLEL